MKKLAQLYDAEGKKISRENRQTYMHEKRMKELSRRGYSSFAIRYMMGHKNFNEKQIEKASKNPLVKTDGKL